MTRLNCTPIGQVQLGHSMVMNASLNISSRTTLASVNGSSSPHDRFRQSGRAPSMWRGHQSASARTSTVRRCQRMRTPSLLRTSTMRSGGAPSRRRSVACCWRTIDGRSSLNALPRVRRLTRSHALRRSRPVPDPCKTWPPAPPRARPRAGACPRSRARARAAARGPRCSPERGSRRSSCTRRRGRASPAGSRR